MLFRIGVRTHCASQVRAPVLTRVHSKSSYNVHVGIRTKPWSNGRRWPGLMNFKNGLRNIATIHGGHTSQFTGLRGSATDGMVAGSIAYYIA